MGTESDGQRFWNRHSQAGERNLTTPAFRIHRSRMLSAQCCSVEFSAKCDFITRCSWIRRNRHSTRRPQCARKRCQVPFSNKKVPDTFFMAPFFRIQPPRASFAQCGSIEFAAEIRRSINREGLRGLAALCSWRMVVLLEKIIFGCTFNSARTVNATRSRMAELFLARHT